MASLTTNRRAPTPTPAPAPTTGGGFFAQNGISTDNYRDAQGNPITPQGWAAGTTYYSGALPPGVSQIAQPVNRAQPVGQPVPFDEGGQARPAPSGGQPTPDELLAIVSQFPATYEGAQQANAEVQRRWGANAPQLLDHPTKLDKWQFANGAVYDLMNSAGAPNASWVSRAVPEAPGGHGGGAGGGGSTAPGAYAGASPGYEFRMREGLRALEHSAAARGTLLTGGTLKDINRFGQDYAQSEFQNDFSRNLSMAQLGFNAANAAAQYGSAYGNQAGNLSANQGAAQTDLITGAGNAGAAGTIGAANANRQTLGDIAGTVSQIPWWVQMARQRTTPTAQPIPTTTTAAGQWGPWTYGN